MTVEEYLHDYFSGQIDSRINKFERKINAELPDEYYCTLDSVTYVNTRNDTNDISDPIGARGTSIADLTSGRDDRYLEYLNIKNTLDELFNSWPGNYILILKAYVNYDNHTLSNVVEYIDMNRYQMEKRLTKLINIIEKRLNIEDDSDNSRYKEVAV